MKILWGALSIAWMVAYVIYCFNGTSDERGIASASCIACMAMARSHRDD